MPLTFAQFLECVRRDRNLTQQDMVDLLSSSEDFSKLDLTTFSRWERGITSPKLSKQLLVARMMNEDAAHLIDPETKVKEKNKRHFEIMTNRILNPYTTVCGSFFHCCHDSLIEQHSLCQQLSGFHQNYMGISVDTPAIQQSKMILNAFTDSSDMLVGHLLYGFLPVGLDSLSINPNQLLNCPFVDTKNNTKQPVDMYVISTFGSLPIPRMVSILFMLDILRRNNQIKHLILNCHDQDAFTLLENIVDCELVSKGDEILFGGIKVFGKHYRYVQVKVKAESFLAGKVISDIIPFTSEYIENLLS